MPTNAYAQPTKGDVDSMKWELGGGWWSLGIYPIRPCYNLAMAATLHLTEAVM